MKFRVRLFAALLVATLLLAGNSAWAQKGGKNGQPKGKACCEKFVDANNDGKCDNFVDANGDGKCDLNCCGKGEGQGKGKNCKFVDADGDGKCDLNCCGKGEGQGKGKNCKFVDADGDGKCDLNCCGKGQGLGNGQGCGKDKGCRVGGMRAHMKNCPEFTDANNDGKCDICVAKMDSLKAAGWTKEDFKREFGKMRFNDPAMVNHRDRMKSLIDSLVEAGWDLDEIQKDFEKMKNGRLTDAERRAHRERMKALMDSLKAAGINLGDRVMRHPPHDGMPCDSNGKMCFKRRPHPPCRCEILHHIGENAPNNEAPTKLNFELGNPYPVPAGENLNVTLMSEASAPTLIELYDANGKLVRSIYDGVIKKGENKFDTNTQGLQAGSYILKATVAGQTTSKNVIINK